MRNGTKYATYLFGNLQRLVSGFGLFVPVQLRLSYWMIYYCNKNKIATVKIISTLLDFYF
jgi:hypothetical protein